MTPTRIGGNAVGRITAIATNTFREAVRNRAFLGLMVMALLFILFSLVLSGLAIPDQANRVLLHYGFFSISLLGVIIAVVMGVIILHKEIDKRTIYTIVSKPVRRSEVIVGKYLGMLIILVAEVTALSVLWLLVLRSKGVPVDADILKALLLIFFEIMLVTAVAILFSSFSSPILSGIFTLGVFMVGRVAYILEEMLHAKGGLFVKTPALKPVGEALAAILPDLQVFNVSNDILLGVEVPWSYVLASLGYAMSYVVVFMALAILAFQRRDFA